MAKKTKKEPFKLGHANLILQKWALAHFGLDNIKVLYEALKQSGRLEGFTEEGESHFGQEIKSRYQANFNGLTTDQLVAFDLRIVAFWKEITARRIQESGQTLFPTYFQYVALLFSEIYLDRFFADSDHLSEEINDFIDKHNEEADEVNRMKPYTKKDLRKLAFWMATGSGKTLILHIHIKQIMWYLNKYGLQSSFNVY